MTDINEKWVVCEWDECPCCGSTIEVYTKSDDQMFYDGDPVRCTDNECEAISLQISCDEGDAWISGDW